LFEAFTAINAGIVSIYFIKRISFTSSTVVAWAAVENQRKVCGGHNTGIITFKKVDEAEKWLLESRIIFL
jgi:hypothetical protein